MEGLPTVDETIDVLTEPVYEPYRRVRDQVRPGTTVLDIGCGNGKVGAYLVEAGAIVDGIEPHPSRAAAARRQLRHVSEQWAGASLDDPRVASNYDLITFFDVLEHVADPAPLLDWAVSRLAPTGRICALIPNSAHWSFRLKILRGDWSYADHGFFDRTHLRFYDLDTMLALRPPGTVVASIDYSAFGPWSQPWLVRYRPRLFASHALICWRRATAS